MPFLFDKLESRRLFASVPPSSFEQYFLELTNRARANPVLESQLFGINLNEGLNPGQITTAAKPPLALNGFLTESAGLHALWVRTNTQISLVGANGTLPADRMTASGYTFTGTSNGSAENVTALINPMQPLDKAAIDAIHRNLFVDNGILNRVNRVNMLSTSFREAGPGVNQGTWVPGGGMPAAQAVVGVMDFALSTGDPVSNVFLTGVAYNDADADQFYTPSGANGEGLGNVTVTARRLSNGNTFSTATFASGGYSLRLPAGIYDVTATGGGLGAGNAVTYPAVIVGSQNVKRDFTTQQIVPAPVNPGTTPPTTPNPVTLLGDIRGRVRVDRAGLRNHDDLTFDEVVVGTLVYVDLDNSGSRNNLEPFGLVQPNRNSVANGVYRITGLNPGVHTIRVEPPPGYRVSIPRDTFRTVTITSGRETKPGVFAITAHSLISGRVYKDNNFNGDFDAALDTGLRNWRVFLDLNNDGIWNRQTEPSTRSESDGYYAFRDLPVGSYTIRVLSMPGFLQTEPSNNGAYVVQLSGTGLDVIGRDFGQRLIG